MTIALGGAAAQDVSPRDPIVNGGFEIQSPTGPVLGGTPADRCIGIGHQVLYGEDTPQGQITGGEYDDPNPSQSDPEGAANDVADDPAGEALFASGYGHCVWGEDTGYDLCWCNPARLTGDEAVHWSGHDDDTVDDSGVDGDPDREITIGHDTDTNHNLWQAFPSPFQAYTGNFDAFEVTVEGGQIPSNAIVDVTLSATPLQAQSPWLGYFGDCQLTFRSFQQGQNSIDPVDASFSAKSSDCQQAEQSWTGDDAQKRDVLGRLRIVQVSFWGWDDVPTPQDRVVLDDVSLAGATLAAEEAAQGNANPNPTSQTEAP